MMKKTFYCRNNFYNDNKVFRKNFETSDVLGNFFLNIPLNFAKIKRIN